MAKSKWQAVYDFFKSWRTPEWARGLLQFLNDLIMRILIQLGEEVLHRVREKIIILGRDDSMTNRQKFNAVYSYIKELVPDISERYANLLIETLYNELREDGVI